MELSASSGDILSPAGEKKVSGWASFLLSICPHLEFEGQYEFNEDILGNPDRIWKNQFGYSGNCNSFIV